MSFIICFFIKTSSFTVSRNEGITNLGLKHLSTLTQLRFLCFDYCERVCVYTFVHVHVCAVKC